MKRLLFALALLACNKTESTNTAEAAAPAATKSAAPAAPFTGALTGDRVMGSKGLVTPSSPWPAAQAKLEAQMGKATVVSENKYQWGVMQGDDCYYVVIEKQKDDTVGMTMEPMKVTKGTLPGNWSECMTAAGLRKEAVEDPNAPGPPPEGKAIGVLELHDGATKGRSKWSAAPVTVKGLYLNTTSFESSGTQMANLSMTAAKGDLKNSITCALTDPKSVPPKLFQYDPITVKGKVRVRDMMTGGGEKVLDVELAECSIVKGK